MNALEFGPRKDIPVVIDGGPVPIFNLKELIATRREEKLLDDVAQCTFKPLLTSRMSIDSALPTPNGDRCEHLYKDALSRHVVNENRKGEEHSFKPIISAMAKLLARKPSDSVKRHHSAVGAGNMAPKEVAKESFSPIVNKRLSTSEPLSPAQASERLYALRDVRKLLVDKKSVELEQKIGSECSFSPTLMAKSRPSAPIQSINNLDGLDSNSVVSRLLTFGQRRNEKIALQVKAKSETDMAGLTFQPTLLTPKKSRHSIESMDPASVGDVGMVSPGNRFDHLYKDALKRQSEEIKSDGIDTFIPNISAKGKSISRKSGDLI